MPASASRDRRRTAPAQVDLRRLRNPPASWAKDTSGCTSTTRSDVSRTHCCTWSILGFNEKACTEMPPLIPSVRSRLRTTAEA